MASLSVYICVFCLTLFHVVLFMGCVPQQWPSADQYYQQQPQQYPMQQGQQDFGTVYFIEQRLQSLIYEVEQIKSKVYTKINESALFHMDSERFRLYQIKEELDQYRTQGLSEKLTGTVWFLENKISSVLKQLNNYFVKVIKELIGELEPLKSGFRVSAEAQAKLSFIQDNLRDLIDKIQTAASYDDIHKAKYLYQVIQNEFEEVKNMPKTGFLKGVLGKISEIYSKLKSVIF